MKKILVCLLLLMCIFGCSSQKPLTVDSLQEARSKEELAKVLNCDIHNLRSIVSNISNLYESLPETVDQNSEKELQKELYTEDGEKALTTAQFKQMLEKVELTTSNWKDIYEIKENYWEEKDAFGNISYSSTSYAFGLKNGYFGQYNTYAIKLLDNTYNKTLTINDYYGLEKENDKICYYSSNNNIWGYYEFNLDNFTCTDAIGTLIKPNIPDEYIYITDYNVEYVNVEVIDEDAYSYITKIFFDYSEFEDFLD